MSSLSDGWGRRLLATALVAAGITSVNLAIAPAASADDVVAPDCGNVRPYGPMCYFFRSYYKGAQAGISPQLADLRSPTRWLFGPGDGAGQQVFDNAGSGHNRDSVCTYRIYYGTNYGSPYLELRPNTSHPTLGRVNNHNRSQSFFC